MSKEENNPPSKKKMSAYALLQIELNKDSKKDTKTVRKVNYAGGSTSKNNTAEKTTADKDKKKPEKDNKSTSQQPTDPNVPDRSFGDLYCQLCDSHMNSENMWQAHITGKRHLKNVKKGDTDSKYEELDVESNLKFEMRNVKDPIVGLGYIHEIRRREPNVPSYFNCFLCHASLSTPPLVIEHVISLKHRLNYIKEQSPSEYELIAATNLKKGIIQPLVHEAALKLEEKNGRGFVKVKQEKPKKAVPFPKRSFESEEEDDYNKKPPKYQKSDTKEPYVWKAVDTMRKLSGREVDTQQKKVTYHPNEDDFKRRSESPPSYYDSRNPTDYSPKREYMHRRDYPQERHYADVRDYPQERHYSSERDYPSERRYSSERDYAREKRYSPERDYSPEREKYRKRRDSLENQYPKYYDPSSRKEETRPSSRREDFKQAEAADQYYPLPSSFKDQPSVLPHEVKSKAQESGEHFGPIDFVKQIFALPAIIFLKIAFHKLDSMDLKGIDELSFLLRLMNKIRDIICNKLPPEMQNMLRQRFNNMEIPTPAMATQREFRSAENIIPPTRDQQPVLHDFIRDILSGANIANNPSPSPSTAPAQTTSEALNSFQSSVANLLQGQNYNSQNLTPNSFQSQNPNPLPASTQVNLRPTYSNQANTAPTQVDLRPTYSNQANTAPTQVDLRTTYTNPALTQVNPKATFPNPALTQVNPEATFPNPALAQVNRMATYPNQNPAPASYVNQSGSQSYNYPSTSYQHSDQANQPSPGIPGLTLTENEKTEPQTYNNYQSNYSARKSGGFRY